MTRENNSPPRQAEVNRSLVLDTIRYAERLTRADIGRQTHLSPQTVSNVVRYLLKHDLVLEAGTVAPEGRGRPGTTVQLNPHGRFAIGVHVDPSALGVVAVDLRGDLLYEHYEPLPFPNDPTQSLTEIAAQTERAIARTGQPRERMLGIGIATPGPIEDGRMTRPPLLPHWQDFPLRSRLAQLTHTATLLDKDVNAAAQAHLWRHPTALGAHPNSFMFLYIGAGSALTAVLDGQVWRGRSGNAGEAGHFSGNSTGLLCPCGQRGCLGISLGEKEMIEQARDLGLDLPGSTSTATPGEKSTIFARLLRLADDGDPIAQEVLSGAASVIVRVTTVLSELLELDTLIIGGPRWPVMQKQMEPLLDQPLSQRIFYGETRPIQTISSPLGARDAATGAACLVLSETYSADSHRLQPPR
ncbi:ROK family protein [Actinomyces urogenitalis DSM 15434]|uniref:ROK family protein n=2 Tax=Actinomyces urogenitalis TaxID=103621 RepID=C0W4H3_9ACTO|nr:ROK family transcriptional regulator [Actinomyces urogenitalis]EEH66367.1 ROK family protein [Actinomyces urogenitalis DSM 15434]MBS5976811.1 ROK family transcriptional regulator [Actinomyces urogenitalis]MDK8836058.1 ROK family transcriptional regulator [Actinomyces urogenitalis]MDU6152185.1 ROK family transcriptional regulator [Actinomyces urogenitalis]